MLFLLKADSSCYPRGYFLIISKEQLIKTLSLPFNSRPMVGSWRMMFSKSHLHLVVGGTKCRGGKFSWKITKSYFRAAWLHQADEAWNNTRSSSISPNLEFWHFCVPPISHLAMMNATQIYCFPLKKECNFKDTF